MDSGRSSATGGTSQRSSRSKRFKLNPFRAEDERQLLEKRTHNRRRWSHVFPVGEEEFKRHAYVNWMSLCQPAILPLTTDFFPSEDALRDDFLFNTYSVSLLALDSATAHYNSHNDLMTELILQRLTQDMQIVPRTALPPKRQAANTHVLSMGHRITQLSFKEAESVIEVTHYVARWASFSEQRKLMKNNDLALRARVMQDYSYSVFNKAQNTFVPNRQQFRKYAEDYPWNPLDNLVCGDDDKILEENQNYRRILYALVPQLQELETEEGKKEVRAGGGDGKERKKGIACS